MNRRSFLTRSGLALGALIVGEEALEAMARLTHVRKSFPSAAIPQNTMEFLRVLHTFDHPNPAAPFSLDAASIRIEVSRDGHTWQDADSAIIRYRNGVMQLRRQPSTEGFAYLFEVS